MAGVLGSLSRAARQAQRVSRNIPVRHPPPRRKVPARVIEQASRATSHSLSQVVRRTPPRRQSTPAQRVAATRAVSRAIGTTRRNVTPGQKVRRNVTDAPITNPFGGYRMKEPPFSLALELSKLKTNAALRRSYTPATAQREYRQYLSKTFGKAQRYYPGAKREPRVDFADPHAYQLHGEVFVSPNRPGHRTVHLTPSDAWAYVLPGFSGDEQRFARTVPLHEWAHVFQRNTPGPRPLVEGGAEAFAQQLAPKLGIRPSKSNRDYARFSDYVRRRYGRRYIERGQFGY